MENVKITCDVKQESYVYLNASTTLYITPCNNKQKNRTTISSNCPFIPQKYK